MASKPSTKSPHVVLLPFPLLGHLLPTMGLAKKLASNGLVVSFMCAEHRFENVQRAHAAQGGDPRIRLVSLPDKVPRGEIILDAGLDSVIWTAEGTEKVVDSFEKLIDSMMEDLEEDILSPGPPVCIISETFLSWTQDIANKWGIERYVFDPSPAAFMSTVFHVPTLIAEGRLPLHFSQHKLDNENTNGLIAVPGLPPLHESDFHTSLQDISPKFMHDFFIRHCLRVTEASGILMNTFYELEPTAIDTLRSRSSNKGIVIQPVGPLLPSVVFGSDAPEIMKQRSFLSPDDRKCLQWLDSQANSSVVYVAFGSMGSPSEEQIYELALGLEASKQPFLWVLRRPFKADVTQQILHARPAVHDLLPQGFLNRTEKQGLVVSTWAPQLLVLAHPATGSFLTHCGWNSTLESICMGVPLLTFPQFADQRQICRMLVDQLKIAGELHRREDGLSPKEEIEKKLSLFKTGGEGDAMRERARQLRDAARKSVSPGGSSQMQLEEFAQSMSQKAELRRNTRKLQQN
ncbi:hypothetical protein O6H91_16G013100 [Diphasiastrum complanatum]|uniref:Uncharacterized protein n=2 Tax=Diphasiastrum complanatum TaxID=34168 RepID=A0ACC2B9Z0_DIPCM|nr:hypothetical protein O6H91_16G010500 [Diphasiastrum complanatum]KAJ7526578.1 hypothetical protein O6H91_16G013100 [Diphasiastrum complanatum]